MSRHHIDTPDGLSIDLGWDRPLGTFWAQVAQPNLEPANLTKAAPPEARLDDDIHDEPEDDLGADEAEDGLLLWAGCRPSELPTLEHLDRALAPYTQLDAAMKATLLGDKSREGSRLGPLAHELLRPRTNDDSPER